MLRKQCSAFFDVLRKTFTDHSAEVWNLRGAQLKGRDLDGNEYWEAPPGYGSNRARRSLRILGEERLGGRLKFQSTSAPEKFSRSGLSVEWASWLQHRRIDAPSIQELLTHCETSRQVAANVLDRKAKDDEMRRQEIEDGFTTTTQVSHAAQRGHGKDNSGSEAKSSGTTYQPASWKHKSRVGKTE